MFLFGNNVILGKNIAIIIPTLMSGGAEKQSVYLAKVLSKTNTISLIVLYGSLVESKFLSLIGNDNVRIIRLENNSIKKMLNVFTIFKKNKIDIVFSYLASGNFINSIVGIIAGVPLRVGGIRNSELAKKKMLFERFFHNYLLTKTISNSHSAVVGLTKCGFKKKKFCVIHNAFDLKQTPIIRHQKDIVNIISVARFVAQKDYLTALGAISLLKKEQLVNTGIDYRYYLIGYGEQENQIRNWIRDLEIEDKVEIVINPKNLFDYYKTADIFLTTSLFEGLSNSVMEAMSFSLPIVATNAGDMGYLVKENTNGFICQMKEPKQIAEKLKILIDDFQKRKTMGENSYSILRNNFTLEAFEENYLQLMGNL